MSIRNEGKLQKKEIFPEIYSPSWNNLGLLRWRGVHGGEPCLGLGDLLRGETHVL